MAREKALLGRAGLLFGYGAARGLTPPAPSVIPTGLALLGSLPRAYALGFLISPLCGWGILEGGGPDVDGTAGIFDRPSLDGVADSSPVIVETVMLLHRERGWPGSNPE